MAAYKVDFESIPWESPARGVRVKIHKGDGKQLRLVEFTREFIEPDWCRKGHFGYILEGQLEIDFDGMRVLFAQGDGVFIPPGEAHRHKAKVVTDVVRLILVEDI
ncbi:MAG: cupin domain-containing protein [Deltaproteobacteria bacterium]|nr:cupin domain-containing protein [Deltaproteobacteria bacterium]